MLKILHVIDSLRGGGKERQLIEFVKQLDDSKDVRNEIILLKNINQYPETGKLSTRIHVFDRKIKKDPTIFFKIRSVIREFNPDILQSWGSMPSVYCIPFASSGKRIFVNFAIQNGFCQPFRREWNRSKITFPVSDAIIANSYAGIEAYPAKLGKSHVIYNGVHLDRFENPAPATDIRKKFNITTKYVIVMVGAFHPRKDWKTYFNAARIILDRRRDVCFLAIGDGKDQSGIRKMMADYDETHIKFLGRQSDVESIVNASDICVLSTNTDVHREGIANVLIEYMAMEKPVVATLGGGTPEIVDNHYNGLIIPPHNASILSDKIGILLENADLRKKFGQRAKDKIMNGFTIDIMVRSFLDLYQSLIDQRNAS